jgi:hypothetical protein
VYRLRVSAPGSGSVDRTVELRPRERAVVEVSLAPAPAGSPAALAEEAAARARALAEEEHAPPEDPPFRVRGRLRPPAGGALPDVVRISFPARTSSSSGATPASTRTGRSR